MIVLGIIIAGLAAYLVYAVSYTHLRLNRIEGQVRGIKAMVEDERYCVDILNQVSAVQAALNGFSRVLLSNHIKTCVIDEIEAGNAEETVEELCKTIQKLMK